MYEIVSGIPRPKNLPKKNAGSKYPLSDLAVDESFVVPYSEMEEGDTPEKFRNRVYKSARNYALRDFKDRASDPKAEKKEFTAVLMEADDTAKPMRWAKGDVVVWRDK